MLCLSEHWLSVCEVEYCHLYGYSITTSYLKPNQKHGGVLIHASKNHQSNVLDISLICKERDFEACAIEIKELKLVIVALCLAPDGNVAVFLDSLEKLQHLLEWRIYKIITNWKI